MSLPDALSLTASGCPHCPIVHAGLSELVQQGRVGHLKVVNISDHLGWLTLSQDGHIRGDAAYFLALTRDARAVAFLKPLMNDASKQVREISREGLSMLQNTTLSD